MSIVAPQFLCCFLFSLLPCPVLHSPGVTMDLLPPAAAPSQLWVAPMILHVCLPCPAQHTLSKNSTNICWITNTLSKNSTNICWISKFWFPQNSVIAEQTMRFCGQGMPTSPLCFYFLDFLKDKKNSIHIDQKQKQKQTKPRALKMRWERACF